MRFGPDGCGLDAEEHIWSADEVNARCVRLAPGGEIVQEITAPDGLNIFACMLGGDDGRTLLMCAAPDFIEQARERARGRIADDHRRRPPRGPALDPMAGRLQGLTG